MRFRQLSRALWSAGERVPGPRGRTYVLAPFAGGSAYSLADWLPVLAGPEDAAFLLQYPGRGPRAGEAFAPSLAALAEEATAALLAHTSGPPVLVGHSLGAVLCHDVADRLAAAGRETALLVASASRAPHRVDLDAALLASMPLEEWVARMVDDGFAVAADMPSDMLREAVAALREDCLLVARHVPHARPLSCPVLALGGADDAGVPVADLRAWESVTTGPARTRLLPGGHFYYRRRRGDVGAIVAAALAGWGVAAPWA